MQQVAIRIRTDSPRVIEELFGTSSPTPNSEVVLASDASVIHSHHTIRRGLLETAIVLDVVVKITSGVAIKIIGDWLSEKLKAKKAQVEVGGQPIANTTSESIADAVKKNCSQQDAAESHTK